MQENRNSEGFETKDFSTDKNRASSDTKEISSDTKQFDTVEEVTADDGNKTKTFNELDDGNTTEEKTKKTKKTLTDNHGRPLKPKKHISKTARAAKATAGGVWFVFRKILTYMLNFLLTVLLVGIITGAVVALAFIVYIKNYVDPNYTGLDNLKFDSALSTMMYYVDKDGNEVLLEDDTLKSSENRLWADYEDIPKMLIDAYIAVEDQRFLEHNGVDTTRTASAIYNFFIPTSSNYGGGSTITQQLIKNVSTDNSITIQRKVQEIFRALNVEEKYTKEEILEMYLNTIYLSHNSYGVRVAAQTYFGKDLSELTLGECAAIASIGKWPIHYDPITNPQNNLERRNLVLKLMLEQEKITQEQFDEFYDAPIKLGDETEEEYVETIHSYYIDTVMDDVVSDLMKEYGYDKVTASNMLYSGGLQIITCMDPVLQECAEKVFENSEYWPEKSGMQAQSAICIMDPKNGNLLAIVGGLGEKTESRGYNRATHAYRQCGSSIKPVSVYALAIESGLLSGGSGVDDVPQGYDEETRTYWPSNAGRSYRGYVSLDYAIQASINTIAVKTCTELGIKTVFNNMLDYGYTTLVESMVTDSGAVLSDLGASPLALGGLTKGVTVREHTQAYATLANGGLSVKARTYTEVRDSKGRVILRNNEPAKVKYQESTAAIMTDLLSHVITGSAGTARNVIDIHKKFDIQVAGKTGTTNNNYDAYFSGYTPDFLASVWYGYDYYKSISFGNSPAALWNAVFTEIYSYYDANGIDYKKEFDIPDSVVTDVEYCTVSGKLPTEACRKDLYDQQGGTSCIAKGTFSIYDVPTEYCDMHIMVKWDKLTGALCLDGCECPEPNLIEVGFRKLTLDDRALEGTPRISDAQYVYVEVGNNYVYPTDPNVPFFQNILPDGISMGISTSTRPANRVCTEHLKKDDPNANNGNTPDVNNPNGNTNGDTSQTAPSNP